jgi:hypothetical protein
LRHETVKPIVAIVSNAKDVGIYADNVCGVSGKRSQYGRDYYEKFLKTVATPALTKVYALVKEAKFGRLADSSRRLVLRRAARNNRMGASATTARLLARHQLGDW